MNLDLNVSRGVSVWACLFCGVDSDDRESPRCMMCKAANPRASVAPAGRGAVGLKRVIELNRLIDETCDTLQLPRPPRVDYWLRFR